MKTELTAVAVALVGLGCVTPLKPGISLSPTHEQGPPDGAAKVAGSPGSPDSPVDIVSQGDLDEIGAQVAFDHGCAQRAVRLIRYLSHVGQVRALDLDVCGVVRRYKILHGIAVDVTALYPAASLPGPLPPIAQPGA